MDNPFVGVLLVLVMPLLMVMVVLQRMDPEDFEDPGGWKLPKAELVGLGVVLGGMVLGLAVSIAIGG